MSEVCNVTAIINNTTSYTLTFDSNNVIWGDFTNSGPDNSTTIGPGSQLQVFYANGAEGSGTGCQGNVTYGFKDQNGHPQELTLTYKVPYNWGTTNEFGASLPAGMSSSNNGPSSGDTTVVTWTISGSVGTSPGTHHLPCAAD